MQEIVAPHRLQIETDGFSLPPVPIPQHCCAFIPSQTLRSSSLRFYTSPLTNVPLLEHASPLQTPTHPADSTSTPGQNPSSPTNVRRFSSLLFRLHHGPLICPFSLSPNGARLSDERFGLQLHLNARITTLHALAFPLSYFCGNPLECEPTVHQDIRPLDPYEEGGAAFEECTFGGRFSFAGDGQGRDTGGRRSSSVRAITRCLPERELSRPIPLGTLPTLARSKQLSPVETSATAAPGAAAILAHLSPTTSGGGTSLAEDRPLWPSYRSGGLLPTPNSLLTSESSFANANGGNGHNTSPMLVSTLRLLPIRAAPTQTTTASDPSPTDPGDMSKSEDQANADAEMENRVSRLVGLGLHQESGKISKYAVLHCLEPSELASSPRLG
ncbi:hypothetical protein BU17DRAFT_88870 [Hysterangium stoloniferum]|nr:hypothetical protein BU17DRAFT_88870 [Hysterangium stoloniferum]